MAVFEYPNISVEKKTNEQNIQSLKGYLNNLSDNLNYQISVIESRVEALEKEISSLKGES